MISVHLCVNVSLVLGLICMFHITSYTRHNVRSLRLTLPVFMNVGFVFVVYASFILLSLPEAFGLELPPSHCIRHGFIDAQFYSS